MAAPELSPHGAQAAGSSGQQRDSRPGSGRRDTGQKPHTPASCLAYVEDPNPGFVPAWGPNRTNAPAVSTRTENDSFHGCRVRFGGRRRSGRADSPTPTATGLFRELLPGNPEPVTAPAWCRPGVLASLPRMGPRAGQCPCSHSVGCPATHGPGPRAGWGELPGGTVRAVDPQELVAILGGKARGQEASRGRDPKTRPRRQSRDRLRALSRERLPCWGTAAPAT